MTSKEYESQFGKIDYKADNHKEQVAEAKKIWFEQISIAAENKKINGQSQDIVG